MTDARPRVLRHVVSFRFKASTPPAAISQIEDAFASLPARVLDEAGGAVVLDFEWGTDNSPEGLADGFTHCFLLSFRDEAARALYLEHPAHQEFVALLTPHLDRPFVIDYWARG